MLVSVSIWLLFSPFHFHYATEIEKISREKRLTPGGGNLGRQSLVKPTSPVDLNCRSAFIGAQEMENGGRDISPSRVRVRMAEVNSTD